MKSEKGFTGVDIAISVVVLFIFVSLIISLIYGINSSSKEVELKSEATALAVEEIENIKTKKIETLESELDNQEIKYGASEQEAETQQIKDGFYRRIIIQDYNDLDKSKVPDIVKKVTVQILYRFKAQEQKVELSTVLSKEI